MNREDTIVVLQDNAIKGFPTYHQIKESVARRLAEPKDIGIWRVKSKKMY